MQSLKSAAVLLLLGTVAAIADERHSAVPPFPPPQSITIEIQGALLPDKPSDRTTVLSPEDLAALPREQVHVGSNKTMYEGVPLAALLERGGMKWDKKCSPALASYILVEASDGYRAVFSLPEIHPAHRLHQTILADRSERGPLPENDAPGRLIEEREGFAGRWVRQVTKITVRAPELPAEKP